MDSVSRLISVIRFAVLVGVVALLLPRVVVAAECTPTTVTEFRFTYAWNKRGGDNNTISGTKEGPWLEDAGAACSAAGSGYASDNSYSVTLNTNNATVSMAVTGAASMVGGGCVFNGERVSTYAPPSGSPTVSTSTFGYALTGESRSVTKECEQCSQTVGKASRAGSMVVKGGAASPSEICEGGCTYNVGAGHVASGQQDGQWYHWLEGSANKGTGTMCSPGQGGSGTPSPETSPLPPGKCPGTIGTQSVVVPCSETKETKTPTKTESAASSASSPEGSKTGDTSTKRETTCADGTCRTTETRTEAKADGTTETKTTTTEEPKSDFCEKNKSSALCSDEKDESTWGGSCGAFSCGGDAIQCAIAREQHRRNCELFERSDASDRGVAAAGAGDQPAGHPRGSATVVSLAGGFDQTNLIVGSCPADQTISVGSGDSFVLPWSQICGPAELLGNVLVGMTAITCLFIVFRG